MKSIRLSLMVYFLVLLALALGGVWWFVDKTTRETLRKQKESTQALLQAQYERSRARADYPLDRAVLHRAQTLASLVQSQWNPSPFVELYPLGLLTTGYTPQGYLLMPLWTAVGVNSPLAHRLFVMSAVKIQIVEDLMPRNPEETGTEYFQIYSEFGAPLQHSRSLPDRAFTLNPHLQKELKLLEWRFEDAQLPAGVAVRRVTLKAPVSRFRVNVTPPPRRPPQQRRPREPPAASGSASRFEERSSPAIFIQLAYDTGQRDAQVAELKSRLANQLAQLDTESNQKLAASQKRLLWLSLLTFAATLVGGFWLVRLGLAPLQRLSEAVSRVSEKNFQLQFNPTEVPGELRPIVERLSQTLELLQRAFAREKQAAADISHELRTPLAALLTTTEVALRKPRTPEEYRELLEDCRSSSQQISQLVERLLALARLDAGADTIQPRSVNVLELAEQCAGLVRPLAEARGLSLHVHGQGPVLSNADPDKLREVLTNLLHNAIEYNRPRGKVELTVERQNGVLRVQVQDTGIGIAPEARQHIFERFYRVDPSRHADGLHAGLGLAIVKGYVELMGGTIAVDSTPGEGSTFCVHLPIG